MILKFQRVPRASVRGYFTRARLHKRKSTFQLRLDFDSIETPAGCLRRNAELQVDYFSVHGRQNLMPL